MPPVALDMDQARTVMLVLGGVRSGKSRYAQAQASRFDRVTFVATARRSDAEMRRKIAAHRRERLRRHREGAAPPPPSSAPARRWRRDHDDQPGQPRPVRLRRRGLPNPRRQRCLVDVETIRGAGHRHAPHDARPPDRVHPIARSVRNAITGSDRFMRDHF